ncbi:MAG: CBS domain-containing protein [Planctomycetes bacterium]|nr:CBS domain-containing protein [Planctomycetota bacterium]
MNVEDVMSREPRTVRVGERLDAAARVMWEQDCGFVPVVDGNGALVGVLTDRDLCMASYTQGRALGELPVLAAMARAVRTCRAHDPVTAAMSTMQEIRVHRLPVVDARGSVVGVLAMNDLVRAAAASPAALDPALVLATKATIGAPRRPAVRANGVAAATPAAVVEADVVVTPQKQANAAPGARAAAKATKSRPAAKAKPKPRKG